MLWDWDRTLERIHPAADVATREHEGREAGRSLLAFTCLKCAVLLGGRSFGSAFHSRADNHCSYQRLQTQRG